MPFEQVWEIGEVERAEIELSDAAPVRAGRCIYRKRRAPRFDMHYGLELGILLSGRMRRYCGATHSELGPGDVWLVGMWEPHGFGLLRVPCEALVLVMLPQALARTFFEEAPGLSWIAPFAAPPSKRPSVARDRRREVLALGRRIVSKLSEDTRRRGVWVRLLAMEILLLLHEGWAACLGGLRRAQSSRRQAPQRPEASGPGGPPRWDLAAYSRINVAAQLVFENRRFIAAQEAARACRMSRNTFNERFAGVMGVSFAKFALRYRLSGAASQLLRTGDPVKAVARDWGFADASHLHHCFVKHYGCSPAAHRREGLRGAQPRGT